jgi:hypothetical protein
MTQVERYGWHDAVILLLLIIAVSNAWSTRIGGGDTFVSLAAGRDTLAGKIGLPDDWSFATKIGPPETWTDKTPHRVWLNQNWGAHTAYYVVERLFGDTGPVALKWAIIFGTVLLMIRAATARGANRYFAAVIVAVSILVAKSYLDVRPHIFTLIFEAGLIVCLFKWYMGSASWAWVATAILWMWSNTHGGFVFGLGVMGLWLGVQGFMKFVKPASRPWEWRHLFVLGGALAVAIVLAAVANPFGPVNLTHPLVVTEHPIWKSVQEWHPIIDWKTMKQAQGFGSVTEFLVLMGFLAATLVGWAVSRLLTLSLEREPAVKASKQGGRQSRGQQPVSRHRQETEASGPTAVVRSGLFDVALMVVVIYMAFSARRFIPLATVAVVPIMTPLLEQTLRRFKQLILGTACELWTPMWQGGLMGLEMALVMVGCYLGFGDIYIPYHNPNPCYPQQTVLMRMVGSQTFPEKATDFLIHQDLPREEFVDWRWEGYTRWRTDKYETFCGGRAQQVHSEVVAAWQISAPDVRAEPIRYSRVPEGTLLNTGQMLLISGQKDGTLAEIRLGETPLAKFTPAITIRTDGRTERLVADRTVDWRFAELTEVWADIDITVERTAEPRFTADYRVTVIADQPWALVTLKQLKNTGSNGYLVTQHALLMQTLHAGDDPVNAGPIAYWQSKEFRYGLAVSRGGEMSPVVQRSGQTVRSEAVAVVEQLLNPGKDYAPKNGSILTFVHRMGPEQAPGATFGLLQNAQGMNCREVVRQADNWKIKIFVLPRRSWGLARLLIGSRRWVCVYDDGNAFVLLNARDEKCKRTIDKILAGQAWYPDAFLKSFGMALTRSSIMPVNADPSRFREDLKAALEIRPHWMAYWLLQTQYAIDRRPEVLKEAPAYWQAQWDRVAKLPTDAPLAREVHQCRQIIAETMARLCQMMGRQDEAQKWRARASEAHDEITRIQRRYM